MRLSLVKSVAETGLQAGNVCAVVTMSLYVQSLHALHIPVSRSPVQLNFQHKESWTKECSTQARSKVQCFILGYPYPHYACIHTTWNHREALVVDRLMVYMFIQYFAESMMIVISQNEAKPDKEKQPYSTIPFTKHDNRHCDWAFLSHIEVSCRHLCGCFGAHQQTR